MKPMKTVFIVAFLKNDLYKFVLKTRPKKSLECQSKASFLLFTNLNSAPILMLNQKL